MKKEAVFRGTATAIITPFRDDKIDYAAYGAILENQIACGVDAIVVCGTTGEAATLDDREHREIVEYTASRSSQAPARTTARTPSSCRATPAPRARTRCCMSRPTTTKPRSAVWCAILKKSPTPATSP